jgi:O-antigen/teichoic acid export membrane protein
MMRVLRNPVLSNTAAIILLRGTNTASRLAVMFLIARGFAPSVFGIVVLAFTVTEIAKVVADFGVDTLAVREYAVLDTPEAWSSFAGVVALAKLVCGVLVYLVVAVAYLLTQDGVQLQIGLVASLLLLTNLWINFSVDFFQGRLETAQVLAPSLICSTASVLAIALLFWGAPNLIWGLWVLVCFELLNGLLLFLALRKRLHVQPAQVQAQQLRSLLLRCLPVVSTALIVALYTRLDVVVINTFFSAAQVGYYGLAFRMTEPFLLVAASLAMSIYSRMASLLSVGELLRARGFLVRYSAVLTAYGLVACLLLGIVAPIVVTTLLPAYSAAIPIVQLLAVTLFVRTINSGLNNAIMAFGHYAMITGIASFNLVFIGAMLLVLVPRFGAAGAAMALLIGEVINTLLHLGVLRRLFAPLTVQPSPVVDH